MGLEDLAIKQAELSRELKPLKTRRRELLEACKHNDFKEVLTPSWQDLAYGNCLVIAYEALQAIREDNPGDCYEFEEVLHEYGCDACIESYKVKREIGKIGSQIGRVRSAITRIGNRLIETQKEG